MKTVLPIGDTKTQAAMLLHEMGHVYDWLIGSKGSAIKDDSPLAQLFGGPTSDQNRQLIIDNCFK